MTANILFLTIGLFAGICGGIFGIGGGVVIVPLYVLLAKMPQKLATGTSLALLLPPLGLLGAIAYWRAGNVDVRAAVVTAIGLFIGAYIGAHMSLGMSDVTLKRSFAVLLVVIAGRLWFSV